MVLVDVCEESIETSIRHRNPRSLESRRQLCLIQMAALVLIYRFEQRPELFFSLDAEFPELFEDISMGARLLRHPTSDLPSNEILPSRFISAAESMSLIKLSASLRAAQASVNPVLLRVGLEIPLTMVHLLQAMLKGRQIDCALLLCVQLLPQRPDPGVPFLLGLAIHSRVLVCYLGFMA